MRTTDYHVWPSIADASESKAQYNLSVVLTVHTGHPLGRSRIFPGVVESTRCYAHWQGKSTNTAPVAIRCDLEWLTRGISRGIVLTQPCPDHADKTLFFIPVAAVKSRMSALSDTDADKPAFWRLKRRWPGNRNQGVEVRPAVSTAHVDKAAESVALALCLTRDWWQVLAIPHPCEHGEVTLTQARWSEGTALDSTVSFPAIIVSVQHVCALISQDVWARLLGTAPVVAGGQCMCALKCVFALARVCVYLPGGGGLGPDCNDNGEEFKWEKRGRSGTFARRMEEALAPLLFFLFVILPLYLSITNPPLCGSLTRLCLSLKSLC